MCLKRVDPLPVDVVMYCVTSVRHQNFDKSCNINWYQAHDSAYLEEFLQSPLSKI